MLRVLKNKFSQIVPRFGFDDITGSNGLGINTPSAVKKIGQVGLDLAKANITGNYKNFADDYLVPNIPGPGPGPQSAAPVNAKAFGNTQYSEQSLYKEGLVPGSIDAQKYRS